MNHITLLRTKNNNLLRCLYLFELIKLLNVIDVSEIILGIAVTRDEQVSAILITTKNFLRIEYSFFYF